MVVGLDVPDSAIEPFFNIVRNTLRKIDDEPNLTIFLKGMKCLLINQKKYFF
jgi:hypothetical protein